LHPIAAEAHLALLAGDAVARKAAGLPLPIAPGRLGGPGDEEVIPIGEPDDEDWVDGDDDDDDDDGADVDDDR
jgi:hypothetical protein